MSEEESIKEAAEMMQETGRYRGRNDEVHIAIMTTLQGEGSLDESTVASRQFVQFGVDYATQIVNAFVLESHKLAERTPDDDDILDHLKEAERVAQYMFTEMGKGHVLNTNKEQEGDFT